MDVSVARYGAPGDDGGLGELRIETLSWLVIVIGGLAFASVVASIAAVPSATPPPWFDPLPALIGLGLTGGATAGLLRRGPLAATIALTAGAIVTLSILVALHPGSRLAEAFFLIVLAATGAYDWRAGLGAAVASSLALLVLGRLGPDLVPSALADQSLAWIWATLALAWLPTRPLRATIRWAWSSYQVAEVKTEEARLRQAELVGVSKSLADACARLERLNRELQEAKDAAETARRLKAEFAATVGHELRTPINLIVGFSQMMAVPRGRYYEEPLPDAYRADLQTIYHNACHISSLVDDILDLSQIDAHRMALHRERTDLSEVARAAAAAVQPLYAAAGLYLSVDLPPDLPGVLVDPVRIRQVLINLLYNAVGFTRQGGVVVTGRETDAEVVVAVHDTGVGIPPASLERVFEEFRQVAEACRDRTGSGLGLAVCKRFVELHGGNIWAESELDFGTTISFSLPRQPNVASATFRRESPRCDEPARPDVAVLDESGQALRVIQRYLDDYNVRAISRAGQAARLAHNGELRGLIVTSAETERAWHAYQRDHPEVVGVPTFVCPLQESSREHRQLDAAAYLTKPVSRDQLARVLRRLGTPLQTVVVVEDNREMRQLLTRLLRSIAHRARVIEAEDGEAGLRVARETRPDVVILDLMMPGADGYAVLDALRDDDALRATPVVVVSARGPNEEVRVGMVGVSRPSGLTVGEAMGYLKANLDSALRPTRDSAAEGSG